MNWIIYSLIAIGIIGVSDIFRKLASGLKDPFFANLIFQIASVTTALLLYLLFSRKTENNPRDIYYAILGGMTVSMFSLFSFKALATGPGISIVMPILRIGGIIAVVILGLLILKENVTTKSLFGLVLSILGIFLLFTSK